MILKNTAAVENVYGMFGYRYLAHILVNNEYCGIGKYCYTWDEVCRYFAEYGIAEDAIRWL